MADCIWIIAWIIIGLPLIALFTRVLAGMFGGRFKIELMSSTAQLGFMALELPRMQREAVWPQCRGCDGKASVGIDVKAPVGGAESRAPALV